MNFFQAQDDARRKTFRLAVLFGAAVISLVVLTNLLVAAVFLWTRNYAYPQPMSLPDLLGQLPLATWLFITTGVVGLIAVASLYKFLMLRGGGRAVAESLGGRPLGYDTLDLPARRLLNVVEEMAIASGVPVPPVYLIDEPSINAFAAGFSPDDAVIGINRGTLDHLSRDELQGVIAHEFSHILNGDMRLNLRLIAVLHGIVFLSMIGYGILRGSAFSGRRRSSGGGLPILLLGVGLLVIGYSGTFFGNLIRSAVSRQREYLADAAAVQFTRNPSGIAGALKKIGGLSSGSRIDLPAAAEASHMFFGQVRTLFLNSLMATHPPLERRIRAIDPAWDGRFPRTMATPGEGQTDALQADRERPVAAFAGSVDTPTAPASAPGAATSPGDPGAPARVVDSVGRLDASALDAARTLIAGTDDRLRAAAHDPWGCRALLYALLLADDSAHRERQLSFLKEHADNGVPDLLDALWPLTRHLDDPHRLLLVEMAIPALKSLSHPQYQRFIGNLIGLIKSDRVIDLFEWVLHRLLLKEVTAHFEDHRPVRVRHRKMKTVHRETSELLSALARSGNEGDAAAQQRAYTAGAATLEIELPFDPNHDPNFMRLNAAISVLRTLAPLVKPRLIKACAATALDDERISAREGALLQGVAAALDCPLPPSIYSASR
ncbi:MAG: M48 family metallopeptidase [Pseudomonadales bacterium]